ncbi:hypothetical protein BO70DRAFT_112679 [Aspergillus heteromorphus CBS 117.55]|uniref:Uncharacterized protein n=1 Tax=Aspergillus heteromorphus CBS 117.55 TaxID=1448321 RepID=A0A317VI88_9EURO|nr:uncharacterized protein BO70DRAFT_112679 [Aspergillus heteromorphus CBS 117.55]PWY72911.1 hypothetical protein BO70DRAFT_112679 [Aspergillus heteromorphus CBS 117.55]
MVGLLTRGLWLACWFWSRYSPFVCLHSSFLDTGSWLFFVFVSFFSSVWCCICFCPFLSFFSFFT